MDSQAMDSQTATAHGLMDTLVELQREISYLHQRVAHLESSLATGQPAATTSAANVDRMSEELLSVISAAVAAFLGERPHIRQIRLLGGNSWMHQGRATIQASHALSVKHG